MSIFTPPHLRDATRWSNRRIGLLGGSFDPPHEGHIHISLAAMKGLKLDAVWWLITPQNPLKDIEPAAMDERLALCRKLVRHARILVSDIEKDLGTNITYYTIKKLKCRFPKTSFAWISGMDNALTLHQWQHWKDLLEEICMVHLTRNPARSLVKASPLRMLQSQKHVFLDKAGALPLTPGTTYWMMQKKMINISSTELRHKRMTENGGQSTF